MKKRVFRGILLLSVIAAVLSSCLVFMLSYNELLSSMKLETKREAGLIKSALELSGSSYLDMLEAAPPTRVTLISSDGTVLFDSEADTSKMENHSNRPEIIDAIAKGTGEATRFSNTMQESTYYYAVALSNGGILRVATTTDSVFAFAIAYLPYIILILIIVILLSILFANVLTKKIIHPINKIDLENPSASEAYDELSSLLNRIEKQNNQIKSSFEELKKQRNEFAAITENMNEGLIVLNSRSTVLSINNSATRLFGQTNEEIIGKHILTLNRSIELQHIVASAHNGNEDETLLSQNGRFYQITSTPVVTGEKTNGVVLLVIDVTEKHAAEQMRKEFSANVSHELKTPLQSISGYSEIIKNGMVKAEDIPRFAERIHLESRRLILLIEDIIKLSRLDENHPDVPHEEVDLFELSKEVSDRLIPLAEQSSVTVTVTGEHVKALGSRQLLDELIFNLCDNAIKYNRENGSVTIAVASEHSRAVLTVTDTGIGIPKAFQSRIFERFYRVDKSHSKETGGTGLGLSIVKHVAMVHGAKIELDSQEGKGTIIRIKF